LSVTSVSDYQTGMYNLTALFKIYIS